MRFALALLVLLGCARRVPPQPVDVQVEMTPTPWCASALFVNGEVRRGCAPTQASCETEAEKVRQIGALYGIRYVGSCRRRP